MDFSGLRNWARRFAGRRLGLEPVERTVTKNGKTHQQIYWVSTKVAEDLKDRGVVKAPSTESLAKQQTKMAKDGKPQVPRGKRWSPPAPPVPGLPASTRDANFKMGVPTSERKVIHDKLVADALSKVTPVPAGMGKEAIFTMGGPATGKSSMMQGIDESKFVKVDPDGIKAELPEYQKAISGPIVMENAAHMVHEESSYVASRIRDEAIKSGRSLIVDGTGANTGKMLRAIADLKKAGYHITVLAADLEDVDTAYLRASERSEREGRLVPESELRRIHSEVPGSFMQIAKAGVDHIELFDTFDRKPRSVFSKSEGKETAHDPAYFAKYKKRAGVR
jgi:predicted ABC-type ATPase